MHKPDILIVDDSPAIIQVMANILSKVARLRFATSGPAALALARDAMPDLILLDAEMPGMNGYEVCEALKDDPELQEIPVIFVTSHSDAEFEVRGLEIGAADFIAKPVSEPLLVARVRTQLRMKRLNDELRHVATVDPLTEVANRRAFEDALQREWRRSLRENAPLSMLRVEVDHFKAYGERYGHPAADVCLRAIAASLKQSSLRPGDLVGRLGGENFGVLMPQTSRLGAMHIAHRVLALVERVALPHELSPTSNHVTVSVGMATFDEASSTWEPEPDARRYVRTSPSQPEDLMLAADKALQEAKRAGHAQGWWRDVADAGQVPSRDISLSLLEPEPVA